MPTSESENSIRLTLQLSAYDDAELEDFNRQLQQELHVLDEVIFELALTRETPADSKSGVASIDWTTLFVTLAASGGVLTTFINLILSKLTQDRSVTLEIDGDKLEVTGITPEEQKRLIDGWLRRHQMPKKDHA